MDTLHLKVDVYEIGVYINKISWTPYEIIIENV